MIASVNLNNARVVAIAPQETQKPGRELACGAAGLVSKGFILSANVIPYYIEFD